MGRLHMKLADAVEGYLLFKAVRASPNTIETDTYTLKQFLRWRGECDVESVTASFFVLLSSVRLCARVNCEAYLSISRRGDSSGDPTSVYPGCPRVPDASTAPD